MTARTYVFYRHEDESGDGIRAKLLEFDSMPEGEQKYRTLCKQEEVIEVRLLLGNEVSVFLRGEILDPIEHLEYRTPNVQPKVDGGGKLDYSTLRRNKE